MTAAGDECPPLLKAWQARLDSYQDEAEKRARQYEKNRRYSAGDVHDDGKSGLVRTNLIYANQATIVPHTYAKNPEIAVAPSPAVNPKRYGVVKKFAQTLEIVLNRLFVDDTCLKQRMRSNLYSIQNTGEGWLKMIYQRDKAHDPQVRARINDAQDNLQRIERLLRDTKDDRTESREVARKRDELKTLLAALQSQVEVVVAEGLVIDRVLSEDITILDRTLYDFDYYTFAEAIDHRIWMTKDEYEEQFGGWPEQGAPALFARRELKPDATQAVSLKHEDANLVCLHELWNKGTNTVFTFAEGAKQWAREPYAPAMMPERWYCFYRMGWNFLDGQAHALPDVTLQRELNDEYNRSRTQFAEHREDSMPVRMVRGNGALTQADLDNIRNRRSRQIIVVDGKPGEPLGNDLGQMPAISLDPNIYDTTSIRADMEMMAGRGDAAAGSVMEAKTATEAEILQQGLMSRSDFRRDVVEDGIKEMATAGAQMLLQELTVDQVMTLAGEQAVWPKLSKWDVFNLVSIDIRAGSTSKPNKTKEREQWMQLLPLIQQTVQQVSELQMQGQMEMASAMRKLLKETLRRFDERIDIEEFLGPEGEEGEAGAQAQMQQQQQMMQLQQQLEEAQAQLQQVDQEKLQQQTTDQQYREREMRLKEQDYVRQGEERQAAQQARAMQDSARTSEGNDKVTLQREQWDRDDQRAEQQRDFEREQKALEQQVAQLAAQLEANGQTPGAAPDTAVRADIEQVRDALSGIEEMVASERADRTRRQQLITHYLAGPRSDEARQALMANLTRSVAQPQE